MSVEINLNEDVIITSGDEVTVEINSGEDIISNSEVAVEAKLQKWTITGDDIYIANRVETLPLWFQGVLDNFVSDNSTLSTGVNTLINTFDNFETGYNQEIGLINDNLSTLSYNLTTNYVSNANFNAGIQNLELSKVTADEAIAISNNSIGAWQIDPLGGGAFFDSKISTYSSDIQSQATSINSLSAQYGDVDARVDDVTFAYVDADGYNVGSSKLATNSVDNSIVGWEFNDGTHKSSEFKIFAEKFSISDGTNPGLIPFQIENNEVTFGHIVKSSDFTTIGGDGFRLKANAAGTFADPTIYGSYIRGGSIVGNDIVGGTIEGATIIAGNIVSQDIVEIDSLRNESLLTGGGSFDVQEKTINLTENKKIIIDINTDYDLLIEESSASIYSDKFHAELVIDNLVVWSSVPKRLSNTWNPQARVDAVDASTHWGLLGDRSVYTGIVPKAHSYTTELTGSSGAGTDHIIKWRIIQDDGVGDNIVWKFILRSITTTIVKI